MTEGKVTPSRRHIPRNPEDTTTDEEKEEQETAPKYTSIKLPGERWNNKVLGRELKRWLRKHTKLRYQSYSTAYAQAFLEVAQLCSKFTNPSDQDRAIDEVYQIFREFPDSLLLRQFPQYNNANLLQLLTELSLPYWMNRILFQRSKSYDLTDLPLDVRHELKMLACSPDQLGNTFPYYLAKLINKNRNLGIYTFHQSVADELWFSSIKEEYKICWTVANKFTDSTPRDLIHDKLTSMLLQKELERSSTKSSQRIPHIVGTKSELYLPQFPISDLETQVEALKLLSTRNPSYSENSI